MTVPLVSRLSLVGLVAGALTASANASANHYALTWTPYVYNGDADEGSAVDTTTALLNSACSDFVDHEMWYGVSGGGAYWVEVGLTTGDTPDGCLGGAEFWADNRSGGGYHEHYPGYWGGDGATYEQLVQQNTGSSCQWDVWRYNYPISEWEFLGSSTSNCPGSNRYLAAGIETTSTASSQQVKGNLTTWERLDSSRTWRSGWDGPTLSQDSPPYIEWLDPSHDATEEVLNESF